jgi:VIT1/CCC1 family predicted Fe2+/Mn2+ transporter
MKNSDQIFAFNARNELTEHLVYQKLASREKNPNNKAVLEKLSLQEKEHYEFWQSLVPNTTIAPRSLPVASANFLRVFFGVTFVTKLLEGDEKKFIKDYEAAADVIPQDKKQRYLEIIEEEKSHEAMLIGQLKEKRVSYISFIVLGLADAIVEITGVHAGFLGVTGSTLIAGISGVIVGFSAAISMGSASYLQAKQEPDKSAIISGLATGLAYFFSVILLALPYFLIRTMIVAFTLSTSVGIILIAGFTFYGAVVFDRKFWREFAEATGLMLTTALLTYILGTVIGNVFHIHPNSF